MLISLSILSHAAADIVGQHVGAAVNTQLIALDNNIIACGVAPFDMAELVVIIAALIVHPSHIIHSLKAAEAGLTLHTGDLEFLIGSDENSDKQAGIIQKSLNTGSAQNDEALALVSLALKELALELYNLLFRGVGIAVDLSGHKLFAGSFVELFKDGSVYVELFANAVKYILVVNRYTQLFAKLAGYLKSGAAGLAAYSNNNLFFHFPSLLYR